jgi:hypothetical protein
MMPTRPWLRFLLCLLPSLALVSLLPIYPRVTMTRVQMSDHAGDVIEWGFELCSVPGFLDDIGYMRPEQHPAVNLVAILLLAGSLASILAFGAARWWTQISRARRSS